MSKCKNKSNETHCTKILHKIKYVINTDNYFYQINPEGKLNGIQELRGYSDTEYAGDKNIQERVTRYVILINIVITECSYRSKKNTTTLVSKYEYSVVMGVNHKTTYICEIILCMGVVF